MTDDMAVNGSVVIEESDIIQTTSDVCILLFVMVQSPLTDG